MEFKDLAAFKEMEGKSLPPSRWITITQDMINAFADATQDYQWIHVDVERAKRESPFKAPVAHGFMSVSLVSKLIADVVRIESTKMGINYGLNKVRFPHPVPVNSRLRLVGTVKQVEDYPPNGAKITWSCIIEIEGVDKPACAAEFISLTFE